MPQFRKHLFDWIAWALFASVPALIFWQSATSLSEQGAAAGGPLENAAFYPRVIAALLGIAVAVHGVRLLFGRISSDIDPGQTSAGWLPYAISALFIIYLMVLPTVGFHILTPVLLLIMMSALGLPLRWAVPGGIAVWLGASYVFEGMLNVVLPVGIFNLSIFN